MRPDAGQTQEVELVSPIVPVNDGVRKPSPSTLAKD